MKKAGLLHKTGGFVLSMVLLAGCPLLLLNVFIAGEWTEKYALPGVEVTWEFQSDGDFIKETRIIGLPTITSKGEWSLDIFNSMLTITLNDDDKEYKVDYDSDDQELTLEDSHGNKTVLERD